MCKAVRRTNCPSGSRSVLTHKGLPRRMCNRCATARTRMEAAHKRACSRACNRCRKPVLVLSLARCFASPNGEAGDAGAYIGTSI